MSEFLQLLGNPLFLAVLGTGVASAGVTGFFLVVNDWLRRRSEERRHRLEIAVKTAFTHYEHEMRYFERQAKAEGKTIAVPPYSHYILYMVRLMNALDRPRHSNKQLIQVLADLDRLATDAFDDAERRANK